MEADEAGAERRGTHSTMRKASQGLGCGGVVLCGWMERVSTVARGGAQHAAYRCEDHASEERRAPATHRGHVGALLGAAAQEPAAAGRCRVAASGARHQLAARRAGCEQQRVIITRAWPVHNLDGGPADNSPDQGHLCRLRPEGLIWQLQPALGALGGGFLPGGLRPGAGGGRRCFSGLQVKPEGAPRERRERLTRAP